MAEIPWLCRAVGRPFAPDAVCPSPPAVVAVPRRRDPHDSRRKVVLLAKMGREMIGRMFEAAAQRGPVDFDSPTANGHLKPIFKARLSNN